MATKKRGPAFDKVLGNFGAVAISLGGVVGSGIFFILGIAAGVAGPGIILSLIFAGLIAVLTALSFASLGSKITKEGGEYQFVYVVFGPKAGFFVGLIWILSTIISGTTVSLAFASYATRILPSVSVNVVAAIACLVLMLIDLIGLRISSKVTAALVVVKMGALLLFIALALPAVNVSNFSGMLGKGYGGVFAATFLIFFAYAGFGKVTAAAEEIKNAAKTVPRAIMISVFVSALLYLFVAVSAIGAVGADALSGPSFRSAPLADVMLAIGSKWGFFAILAGALTATSSVLLIQLLGASRNLYAMSVNRQLPKFLSELHPKFKTPYKAEIIVGLSMAVMALFFKTYTMVVLTGFGILCYYAVINLAALSMRVYEKEAKVSQVGPVLGLALCIALMVYFTTTLFV